MEANFICCGGLVKGNVAGILCIRKSLHTVELVES